MITIIEGDILSAEEEVIAHQVNCRGVMGAGLAKQIKKKYPVAFKEYKEKCNEFENREDLLGTAQVVSVGDNKQIANLFAQLTYGTKKKQTDYDALRKALSDLKSFLKQYNLSLALPFGIGCGLAGGDWEIVSSMIEEIFEDYPVTLYKYL